MVGIRETTMPAERTFHWIPALEMNEYSATGTVILESLFKNNAAVNISFQFCTKEKLKIAATPGSIKGKVTLNNAFKRVQPSIKADSSNETGILTKNPLAIMVLKAAPNPI